VPAVCNYLGFNPTFENTAMIGSSMGGLATLNALTLRPNLFRTALAFSPHWVIGGKPLVESILNELPKPGRHKIWMSRGDRKLDSTYKPDQDYADGLMRDLGWRQDYRTTVFKKAGHNERAWAKQVDDAFRFWLLD
jgi:predicted alpha/beta superfamily hydrolase